ncbi:MAG: hypothetical protein GWM92_21165 [Gemmatimonadetes bacterium]|nr:hypothetical protein [Gemmatimonadota bacterium]NIR81374.1 hypothetical protein [Gemmatimonadota bacterium]NIT90202.1 hypothetical protein [Gemmatimonadota bacterium]NIU34034.1 hypothetical protein [Gemmatimonadota bacterium]NIU38194.1 hypothetical protein [Gemmatimonadota bacterium]
MNPIDRRTRRILAPILGGLLLTTSVAVPLLDRTAAGPAAALETEHHAATCLRGHDHTICTQVGANLPATDGGHPIPDGEHLRRVLPVPAVAHAPSRSHPDPNPTRAPPFV